MRKHFHKLRVEHIHYEVEGAATIVFNVPPHLTEVFGWQPGQHLTLRFNLNDEEVRRSYSISASPYSGDPLRITVKRVEGGLVSNHINNRVRPGDVIDVLPPVGGFVLNPEASVRRTHYFFGSGSGITPISSMLHAVLLAEPYSMVHLVYGNRSADTILFKQQLAELCEQHPERITVDHVLSRPSIWSSFTAWRRGRIDSCTVEAAIDEHPPYAQDTQYYICGPGGMNRTVKKALMGLDVPANRIHSESYGGVDGADNSVKGIAAAARIALGGQTHGVAVAGGQTILQAARDAGLDAPFSCQAGVCGACKAYLAKGKVHMRARMALEDHEIDRGAILTCQSVATTGELSLSFD